MTTSAPAAPCMPAKQASIAAIASLGGLRHGDALAGGEAVGLDDHRRPLGADIVAGGAGAGEAAIGGRGDAGLGAEVLGEALRALEACRCAARPERRDAGGGEVVDQPRDQRRLRPDDDEVDVPRAAEGDHRAVVGDVEADQLGAFRDAGIARRGIEPGEPRRLRELPGKRMLPSARADEEDVHAKSHPAGHGRIPSGTADPPIQWGDGRGQAPAAPASPRRN